MEQFAEIIAQYGGELLVGGIIIACNIFGKKKTAEEIRAKQEKRIAKLEKKTLKDVERAKKDSYKLEELKKEVAKNA